jgi:hypothetical protein
VLVIVWAWRARRWRHTFPYRIETGIDIETKQRLFDWGLGVNYRSKGFLSEGARNLTMYGFSEPNIRRTNEKTSRIYTAILESDGKSRNV